MANAAVKTKKRVDEDDFFGDSIPEVGERYEDREVDGWYEAHTDIIVTGILVGTLTIPDEESDTGFRRAVLVELKRPAKAKLDERPVSLEAGQVMAIGEKAKLAPLFEYKTGAKVWLKAKGQKAMKGKRSPMWQFDLVLQGEKLPPPPAAPF